MPTRVKGVFSADTVKRTTPFIFGARTKKRRFSDELSRWGAAGFALCKCFSCVWIDPETIQCEDFVVVQTLSAQVRTARVCAVEGELRVVTRDVLIDPYNVILNIHGVPA